MSTTKRLISGSAASWARIAVTMVTQLALVPIFLSYWDVKTYGIWIAIQALVVLLSTLDKGYNDFLQYEFLKFGSDKRADISSMLWSGVTVTALVGVIELLIISVIAFQKNIGYILGISDHIGDLGSQIAWALIIQWIAWSLTSISGLFLRSLCVFGYFPRMSWWNVILAIVTSLSPILAVVTGGNIIDASLYFLAGSLVILAIQAIDIRRLLKKEQINFNDFSIKNGLKDYVASMGLSGRYFLENFRQQGIRLLLAPVAGAAGMATFSIIRTGANVALQGLATITNPLMPELMRFIHQREQKKIDASFDTIWLVLIIGLAPAILVIQTIAPSLFMMWTKGEIIYDPFLFASLSLGVLVYAWGQPAAAIITGNNLVRIQFMISLVSSVILIAGIYILFSLFGLVGAGIALLAAELVVAVLFQHFARKWLHAQALQWPEKSSNLAFLSVLITATGMLLIILFPYNKWFLLFSSCVLLMINVKVYWKNMPLIAIEKANTIFARIPVISKIYKRFVL